jgi:hypothetical protein
LNKASDLAFDRLCFNNMTAGHTVQFGAQQGYPLLIGPLHTGLALECRTDNVVTVDEVTGGGDIAGREHQEDADDRPEYPRPHCKCPDFRPTCDDDARRHLALTECTLLGWVDHESRTRPEWVMIHTLRK